MYIVTYKNTGGDVDVLCFMATTIEGLENNLPYIKATKRNVAVWKADEIETQVQVIIGGVKDDQQK